jgi:nicotinamide mononucleotide transporter
MSLLGIIALISGVLGVILTILQRIWCWPAALISVVASFIEFYDQRLYGDMALQGFYFVSGIYGWWYWSKKQQEEFVVSFTPKTMWLILGLITVIQSVVYYFLLKKFKGDQVFLDAVLTAASITATYMMTKKWLENWIAWVIIDFAYILLYGIKFMWLFAILYLVFTVMAAYGFYSWKKKVA